MFTLVCVIPLHCRTNTLRRHALDEPATKHYRNTKKQTTKLNKKFSCRGQVARSIM